MARDGAVNPRNISINLLKFSIHRLTSCYHLAMGRPCLQRYKEDLSIHSQLLIPNHEYENVENDVRFILRLLDPDTFISTNS